MSLRQLVIVGTGGHARALLDVVEAVNAYRLLGFLIDDHGEHGDLELLARRGAAPLGGLELLATLDADYLIGTASPRDRARIDRYASALGRRPATVVHPRAHIGSDVRLGPGTVVCALASVTTNVVLGRHVLVDVGASIAHDCRIGDYVTLAPGARVGGGAQIAPLTTVDSGTVVVAWRERLVAQAQ
ncbi:MAG: UDP-glucose 4-epimerase [Frankia sp.]|nr:UDP-glucose 4-epimerase [Frankia sp.]